MYCELFMTPDKISGKRQTFPGLFGDFASKLAGSAMLIVVGIGTSYETDEKPCVLAPDVLFLLKIPLKVVAERSEFTIPVPDLIAMVAP